MQIKNASDLPAHCLSLHRKLSIAALLSALTLSSAAAAGLGKLTVLSSLGQPLVAEIELTSVANDEAATLAAKLASPEAFQQANIDLNPALLALRFSIEQAGTRQFVRLTSPQPMNEPFIDLLLELSASNGRLVREYTFLLDPPELRSTQAPSVAPAPAVVASSVPTPASAQIAPLPATAAAPAAAPQPEPAKSAAAGKAAAPAADADAEVTVKKGDTLSKIALQHKVSGVSLDQMLVSLYRANPDAFVGKNMNRLRAGRVLSLPASEDAAQLAPEQARREVMAQAVDFTAYREKLARQAEGAQAKDTSESAQSASGKMNAKVSEQAGPAADARDKLKLSKSMDGKASDKNGGKSASVEDKIAQDKAKAEDAIRIKELERTNAEVQKLLEMKNKELAQRQKQAELDKTKAAPVVAVTPDAIPAPDKAPVAAPAKTAAASESLLDSPFLLPGAGILALILGGVGFYALRRRQKNKQDVPVAVDSDQDEEEDGDAKKAKRAAAKPKEPEPADPIAEADVYIAYGRDEQAELILKEALKLTPDRHPVRAKLMEIYVNRQDAASYEMQAHELLERAGRQSEFWLEAAATGLVLDPENPLYGGKEKAPAVQPQASVEEEIKVVEEKITPVKSSIDDLDFDLEGFVESAPKPAAKVVAPPVESPAAIEDEFAAIEDTLSRQDAVEAVEASTPAAAPMDFDLSDITLDLDPANVQTEEAQAQQAQADVDDQPAAAADDDIGSDATDMATKLDLAIAYQEIGDNEGARELLEEVVEGGTLDQIIQARTLMQQLG